MLAWWNGRHSRLKNDRNTACEFDSRGEHDTKENDHAHPYFATFSLVFPDQNPALAGRGKDALRSHGRGARGIRRRNRFAVAGLESARRDAATSYADAQKARTALFALERISARWLSLPILRPQIPDRVALVRSRGTALGGR